ncbi:MAG: hypothetical protein K9I95_08875 [Flavobacteriaceae bacterium]|nr:hypothetical protein [Flavobacteriaceae bacterium]
MKYIYSTVVLLILCININAQTEEVGDIAEIWNYPAVYNYDEQVSWYFDLSGTGFADNEDVYIWIWSPTEPDAGNWENSSEFAKLIYEGDFVWRFDLTPTDYFNVTPEEIANSAGFWLRLKDKTGTKMTTVANVPYTNFSSFYTANELIRSYPSKPSIDKPFSILFNSNLIPEFAGASSVHMHSGLNDWEILQEYQSWIPEIVEKTKLKDLGNGFYKMDLIPAIYFNTPDGYVMENITFLFVKDNWAATTPDQKIFAADVTPPEPPVLSFFPLKISYQDFLGIKRINNERGVTKLVYTITAKDKVIEGEFDGSSNLIMGFVDLVTHLNGMSDLESINVVVKDNNGRMISESDIPLVKTD